MAISDDGHAVAGSAGDEDCLFRGVNPPGCDSDSPAGVGANIWVGVAYVFVHRGRAWTEQAFVKASNPRPCSSCGVKLALSGDGNTLAVAAYLQDGATPSVRAPELQPLVIVPNLDPWRTGEDQADESGAVHVFGR